MTLTVVQERVSGSRDSFRIPYYVYDDAGPGNLVERDTAVTSALAQAITDIGTPADNYTDEQLSDHAFRVTAMYEYKRLTPRTPQEPGDPAQEKLAWQAEEYTMYFRRTNSPVFRIPEDAPLWGNHVGKRWAGFGWSEHNGILVPGGKPTRELAFTAANATLSDAYIRLIESLGGHVNSRAMLGRKPGEVRFVMYRIFRSTDLTFSIDLGFEYKPIRNNVTIPNVQNDAAVIPTLYGHDVVWTYERPFEKLDDDLNPITVMLPKYVYVERPDPWSDLNMILAPLLPLT